MKIIIICVFVAFASANPAPPSSPTFEDFIPKDFQLSDYVEISKNGYQSNDVEGRSSDDIETKVEDYMKSHDVTFKLPVLGSAVTFAARNLDNNEVDVKLRFNSDDDSQVEPRKKSKLKKIFVPIFVFILIKAMVLIPLALGILAIKTWNALQLSFVSFVVAVAMGVWQLCKKVAGDNAHPQIIAHSGWDASQYAARSINSEAQNLAYNAYVPAE